MSCYSPGHQSKGGQNQIQPSVSCGRTAFGQMPRHEGMQGTWATQMGTCATSAGKSLLGDRQHLICCVTWGGFLPPLNLFSHL